MNYRHAFHAGNFADVVKHAVLTRILVHLLGKPAAFRVIDTHAGAGVYDLAGAEAGRSGEWRAGIGRLLAAPITPAVQALLKVKTPISRLRGNWHEVRGVKLMPTFHPAYLLRSPGEKRWVWQDIQEVMKVLGIEIPTRGGAR